MLLDQRTATDRQWVTVYLRADGRALTEVATPDGRHAFSAMKRAAALDLAANTLVPRAGDVGTDDPGRNYSPRDWGWRLSAFSSATDMLWLVSTISTTCESVTTC